MKECSKCKIKKRLTAFAFTKSSKGKLYLRGVCEKCRSEARIVYRKIRYSKNKAKMRDQTKATRQTTIGKLLHSFSQRFYRLFNQDKALAHLKVRNAKKSGALTPLSKCSYPTCDRTKVEAHHFNYQKALDVVWLCKPHHYLADKVTLLINNK